MKYVINPQYRLRGWYKAPTGLYDTRRKEARFCLKEQYLLLLHCNGVDDIDESTLSEENAKFHIHSAKTQRRIDQIPLL